MATWAMRIGGDGYVLSHDGEILALVERARFGGYWIAKYPGKKGYKRSDNRIFATLKEAQCAVEELTCQKKTR